LYGNVTKPLKPFLFLRQVSRPAYSYYCLGDEVQLTIEINPVRLP